MAEPSLILAFIGGMLTISTPCAISILPVVLAGSLGHRQRPILIVIGLIVSFTLMGSLFSAIGAMAVGFKEIMRIVFIFFIMGFGLVMLSNRMNDIYARFSSRLSGYLFGMFRKEVSPTNYMQGTDRSSSLLGPFILGLSLGIVWIPCAGPILGSILTYASYQGNLIFGSLLLFIYSIGVATPMLAIAYAGKFISNQINWITRNSDTIQKIGGVVLITIGVLMLLQWDQYLIGVLTPYFPELESKVVKSGFF